jgi:ferritin
MLTDKIKDALNAQIKLEGDSSNGYLAMAVWAENSGFEGVSNFLYAHAEEERIHMLKLVKFINERNGEAKIPAFEKPKNKFSNLNELFQTVLDQEVKVSQNINDLVELTLKEKDYATHNFLQWYVAEQIEEERLCHLILEKLNLIGSDKGGLYLFDRDIQALHQKASGK